jgi:hypothetical protein
MEEPLNSASTVLTELTAEFVRRYLEEMDKDSKSQTIACLLLAMRSASLLCAAGRLLDPRTLDGLEVMKRAFLEARDLLMTFRFDEKGIRNKVEYWFEGKLDNSWNADREKCEQFLERHGCDLDRMPSIEPFRATVGSVVVPVLNSSTSNLPPGSYRGG